MAHLNEKIDFTVCIYIVHKAMVLLHMHKKLGVWLPPGGHIELDEDPNEAAIREAKEETGLDVKLVGEGKIYESPYDARDLVMPRFLSRHFYDATKTHEHVNLAFFARPLTLDARPEEEGGEVRWFSAEELSEPAFAVVADVQAQALAALTELGGVH